MASTGQQLPSFLPPDPKVEEPYLLTPRMAMRVAMLGGIALILFGVLFLRLWSLQILSPEKYETAALEISSAAIESKRRGGPSSIARAACSSRNDVSTAVVLWPANLPRGSGRDTEVRELSKILGVPFWKLRRQIRSHQDDPLTPVTLKLAVSPEEIAYLEEHKSEFPGVDLKQTYLRSYPAEELLAQVLGYVSEISAPQLKRLRKEGYLSGDRIGQSGVESAFDTYLAGEAGIAELRVDSLGRPKSELDADAGAEAGRQPSADDRHLATACRRARDRVRHRARPRRRRMGRQRRFHRRPRPQQRRRPRHGVLPDLPAERLHGTRRREAEATARRRHGAARELPRPEPRDRCHLSAGIDVQADHGAGRACRSISSTRTPLLPCTGSYRVEGVTGADQVFNNWDLNVNRAMGMSEAIAASCDTYFYRLGTMFYDLPPERGHPLQAWASRFGFGALTGVDIGPEAKGILPTPEWREANYSQRDRQALEAG